MDNNKIKKFFDDIKEKADVWYKEAERELDEAVAVYDEFMQKLKGKKRAGGVITTEDNELLEEAREVIEEAHEQKVFFDGVRKGVDAVVTPVVRAMAMEAIANAGRFVPHVKKPRRR